MHRLSRLRDTGAKLRLLLSEKTRSMTDEALRSNGEVSPEKIDSLKRLAQLVDIGNAANIWVSHKRWSFALLLLISSSIISILIFARVFETEIELNLQVSEVGFELPTSQILTSAMTLPSLGISGLRKIDIPSSRNQSSAAWNDAEGRELSVRFSPVPGDNDTSTVTLSPLALPQKAHVFIRSEDLPNPFNQVRLSIMGPDLHLHVAVNGHLEIQKSGGSAVQLYFAVPTFIDLAPLGERIDLDLTPLGSSFINFSPQINVQNLSLIRVDEFLAYEHPIVRQLSTILTGTLYFNSLNDQQQKLRAGELLQLEHSTGEIRSIGIRDGRIELVFHGHVGGIYTGSPENRTNLMPSWLDWLRARHQLSLFWGTTIYLFGIGSAVLKWWKGP